MRLLRGRVRGLWESEAPSGPPARAVARSLELEYLSIAKQGCKRVDGQSHMRLKKYTENLTASTDLSCKLARYVLGSVRESERWHVYSVAVDKATPKH